MALAALYIFPPLGTILILILTSTTAFATVKPGALPRGGAMPVTTELGHMTLFQRPPMPSLWPPSRAEATSTTAELGPSTSPADDEVMVNMWPER